MHSLHVAVLLICVCECKQVHIYPTYLTHTTPYIIQYEMYTNKLSSPRSCLSFQMGELHYRSFPFGFRIKTNSGRWENVHVVHVPRSTLTRSETTTYLLVTNKLKIVYICSGEATGLLSNIHSRLLLVFLRMMETASYWCPLERHTHTERLTVQSTSCVEG